MRFAGELGVRVEACRRQRFLVGGDSLLEARARLQVRKVLGGLPHGQLCRTESSAGRAAVAHIEGAPYSEKNCSGLDFEILGDPQDSVILRT